MKVEQRLGRVPTHAEIAEELGVTRERVIELIAAARGPMSLDQRRSTDDGSTTISDGVVDESEGADPAVYESGSEPDPERDQRRAALGAALEQLLEPPERRVVVLRYGMEDGQARSLAEVGRLLGVSRERARQVEVAALAKLRDMDTRGLAGIAV